MKFLRSRMLLVAGVVLFVWAIPQGLGAASNGVLDGSHALKSQLPNSCRSCHSGMSMLLTGEESSCLPCHGSNADRDEMVRKGYLKLTGQTRLGDIEAELRKPYAHPTLITGGVHQARETLPEEVTNAARHAECVDCHNPHLVDTGKPLRGVIGKRTGNFNALITKEYELCYKCHAESANLPGNATNKHAEFKITNPSFHPVEGEGKNSYVISLRPPYVAKRETPGTSVVRREAPVDSAVMREMPVAPVVKTDMSVAPVVKTDMSVAPVVKTDMPVAPVVKTETLVGYGAREETSGGISEITCSDCHGSDDPVSPKGPHGSTNEGLLVLGYQKDDALPESFAAYALCYKCHERSSILGDESFPQHSLHIVGRRAGQEGTSCFTCHDAHGSTQYQHLIRFNEDVVKKNKDEKLKYDARGYSARHGSCYLNCHGVEHNPKEY